MGHDQKSRGGGGGGHSGLNRYTHFQTAPGSGSGERQNLGAVNLKLLGQKKGGGQLKTKNIIIGAEAYMLCLYSLYLMKYMAFLV